MPANASICQLVKVLLATAAHFNQAVTLCLSGVFTAKLYKVAVQKAEEEEGEAFQRIVVTSAKRRRAVHDLGPSQGRWSTVRAPLSSQVPEVGDLDHSCRYRGGAAIDHRADGSYRLASAPKPR